MAVSKRCPFALCRTLISFDRDELTKRVTFAGVILDVPEAGVLIGRGSGLIGTMGMNFAVRIK